MSGVIIAFIAINGQAIHYLGLAFITGLAGYQGSPLRMCTVLTVQHFNTSLPRAVRKINLYAIPMCLLAMLYFSILM